MPESTGRASVAACVHTALEMLADTFPSTLSCEFDHLPDDRAQLPAVAVQTLQEDPASRTYIDGGTASRCRLALALRQAGNDGASRMEACELLASLARVMSNTAADEGQAFVWRIEGCSQPYLAESGAEWSDYRVTLAITYRSRQ